MRIVGIDPGLRLTGYACLDALHDRLDLVEAGVFRLDHTSPVSSRLVELDRDLTDLLERFRPDAAGVEGLFAHYKHPATAVGMAHARGVVLLRLRHAGVTLIELKPGEVKKALTGNGQARKPQVQAAVAERLSLDAVPEPPDVADAVAIALCAAWRLAPAAR